MLMMTVCASGQLRIKGSRVFLNGEKISVDQASACFSNLSGEDRSQDYLRYRSTYKAGLGMTVGGAAVAVLGTGTLAVGFTKAVITAIAGKPDHGMMMAGVYSAIGGLAVCLAGIPTMCVYNKKLKNLSDEYNAITSPQVIKVTFGAQNYGLGFALNF